MKLDEPYEELKNQGIEALSQAAPSPDKYDEAIKAFQPVREIATKKKKEEEERNAKDGPQWKAALAALQDPVTLIFLNNAKARKNAKENGSPLYTIATAAPLKQEEGKQILLGVAQVQDKVVAKHNSLNLAVVIANDRNIPDQAKSVAEALVKNQDILGVVGHYTSPNTCAALPVYNENKRVVISPRSTVADLRTRCGGDSNKVFFRRTSTTQVEAETLINHLVNVTKDANPQPKVAVFFTRGEMFSDDLSNQLRQIMKGKGTIIAEIDLAQDFEVKQKVQQELLNNSKATSDAIEGKPISFHPNGDRKEITTLDLAIVCKEGDRYKFFLLKSNRC